MIKVQEELDNAPGDPMDKNMVCDLLNEILEDRGVPRNIRESVQTTMGVLNCDGSDNEKLSQIISVLDDAANDPNMSMAARTLIWNTVSAIEMMSEKVSA